MNNTLEPYIKRLLDGGMKTAEDITVFIEKQTPELGREIIIWGAASQMVAPTIGFLLMCMTIWFHYKYSKERWYNPQTLDEPPTIVFIICLSFLGAAIFLFQIMDVIYPLVAPRLYILEKVSDLIK